MSFIIIIKLIFTFLSSLILIKLIMHNTTFLGLTDIQNERSLHQEVWYWYWDKFLPFTIFALAGFTNALNLIDGLDASISIVILSSFLYIGYIHKNELMIVLSSLTIASLLAFLIFNWNPAKIFMGDSGSLFLGFIISVVACISLEYIHPIAIFYLAALPIVDTLVVMIRRIRKGISPFTPDKTHVHHILLNFFAKKVRKTVFFLILTQVLFSLVGIMLSLNSYEVGQSPTSFVSSIAFIGITILIYMIFTGIKRRQQLVEKLANRRKIKLNKKSLLNSKERVKSFINLTYRVIKSF